VHKSTLTAGRLRCCAANLGSKAHQNDLIHTTRRRWSLWKPDEGNPPNVGRFCITDAEVEEAGKQGD